MTWWAGLLALAPVAASPAPSGVTVAPTTTVQQMFDQASALSDAGKWAEALAVYNELEVRLKDARPRNLAIVRLRKGVALERLGRSEDAAPLLDSALAALPVDDPSLATDRCNGLIASGRLKSQEHEDLDAIDLFRQAAAIALPNSRLTALSELARAEATIDPSQAIVDATRALALVGSFPIGNDSLGLFHDLLGRAMLNAGQTVAAHVELTKAFTLLGGASDLVSLTGIETRSDLAIASQLANDNDAARRELAMAGAGSLTSEFPMGGDMEPPRCDPAAGVEPEDVVVVQFGVNSDGTVGYARPVYASRPGPGVLVFARAVANWSWKSPELAKITPFFRAITRVELRCSSANKRSSPRTYLDDAVRRWLDARSPLNIGLSGVASADLMRLRTDLARQTPNSLARAHTLLEISRSSAATSAERDAAAREWAPIVLAAAPPPVVYANARLNQLTAVGMLWPHRKVAVTTLMSDWSRKLLTDPIITGDAEAINAIRLFLVDSYLNVGNTKLASPLVEAAAEDTRLGPDDPLRVGALVRRSEIALAAGDLATARAAYDASGITDAQCAMIGIMPLIIKGQPTSADYPLEALRWGLTGWVVNELDINADGSTRSVRAVVAYPPFAFDRATIDVLQKARFQQTYRPAHGTGCGAWRHSTRFTANH